MLGQEGGRGEIGRYLPNSRTKEKRKSGSLCVSFDGLSSLCAKAHEDMDRRLS